MIRFTPPVTLPVSVLAAIARMVDAGDLPMVLTSTPGWRPRLARQELDSRARQECRRLAWMDRRGRIDAEVEAALRIVCRPWTAFYGWIGHREHKDGQTVERVIGVQAAGVDQRGMLAVRIGNDVWLSQIPGNKLPDRLAAQTPDVAQGAGQRLSVAAGELAGLTPQGRHRAVGGVVTRQASTRARAMQRLMALPITGTGELHVAVRDEVGRRRHARNPVRYIDTAEGRYLYESSIVGGEAHLAVVPASRDVLTRWLRGARQALSDGD